MSRTAGPADLDRRRALRAMEWGTLDLLVVGGGITGAGVARDAALRGMSVALVEKSDFAAGTSGRSSKIIHGGVRYLEHLQFGLVRESVRERAVLRRIAPHLVHPLPFLYPVWKGESFWKIRAGLLLFDVLAGRERVERSRRLDPEETRARLPGLRDPLKGAVLYPEFITDDARFTLANVRSAAVHGAHVANHARVEGFLVEDGRVVGARVRDRLSGRDLRVRARVTVNATGPWVQEVLGEAGFEIPKPIVPSKGIHLLFSRARLPLHAATFLRSPSGRAGLAMPRGPWVYVGTSDEEYRGDMDRPRAEPDEVDDLLSMTRDCFPELELGPDDVVATWAGIRPLVREEGKTTREMSRHDEVWVGPPGLVTVGGGKLTTYRPMARRILREAARATGRRLPGSDRTARVSLPGAPTEGVDAFRDSMERRLEAEGVDAATRERLFELYGDELRVILAYGEEDRSWIEPLAPGVPALRGEVRHAVEREMALTLSDILDRRLALLLFSPLGARGAAPPAAEIAATLLGWDGDRTRVEVDAYVEVAREHGPRGRATPPSPRAAS
jgi:glycerol-3-phosphate dehydrogenase